MDITNLLRLIGLRGTKAQIESFTGSLEEQAVSYATDTNNLGIYTNGAWQWIGGLTGTSLGIQDEGVSLGTASILNVVGQNASISISGTVARLLIDSCGTYLRTEQPIPLQGSTGTLFRVPDGVYASGSLGVFYNGVMQLKGYGYEELIYVSGTYQLLFVPSLSASHMVSYGVPCTTQTYITGSIPSDAMTDSQGTLMVDSQSNQIVDS